MPLGTPVSLFGAATIALAACGLGGCLSSQGHTPGSDGGPLTTQIVDASPIDRILRCCDVMPARCGDGVRDWSVGSIEQCDDGNTVGGDGCSASCQVEANYSCPDLSKNCVYVGACGDGSLQAGEACDDGNTVGGDGCSADCVTIEAGWECLTPFAGLCTPACGDGHVVGSESCDDGNGVGGDGCSAACQHEPDGPAVCGDGVVAGADEECDLGAANADPASAPYGGCTTGCKRAGYCGDGAVNGWETCDLGKQNGDASLGKAGCTVSCRSPSYCGDGFLDPGEGCDFGELNSTAAHNYCTSSCYILPI